MSRRRDCGEANALGLVLIAPVAIALAIMILWIGRKVDADAQMQAASSAAAQAAARQRNPTAADLAARIDGSGDAHRCEGLFDGCVRVDRSFPVPRRGQGDSDSHLHAAAVRSGAVRQRVGTVQRHGYGIDRSLPFGGAAMSHGDDHRDVGSATVLMITLCFMFLAGALVWLSRTVDQSLDDRTNASAIAFQAARAGAQALDSDSARAGVALVDPVAARVAVATTTKRLLDANGDSGSVVAVSIDSARVTVSVTITTTGRPATGTASATAVAGVDAPSP